MEWLKTRQCLLDDSVFESLEHSLLPGFVGGPGSAGVFVFVFQTE